MSYLLNYKGWRTLHESMSLNESIDTNTIGWASTIPSVKIGDHVLGDAASGNSTAATGITLDVSNKENNATYTTMEKIVGPQALPNFRFGNTQVNSESKHETIFGLILAGIGQYAGSFDAISDINKIEAIIPKLNLSLTKSPQPIQLIGKSSGVIDTNGVVEYGIRLKNTGNMLESSLSNICGYINAFNLQNWASGSFEQYDPTKLLDFDKVVDLTSSNREVLTVEKGFIMLVSPASSSVTGGDRGVEDTLVQGEAASTAAVDIAFTIDRADIDDKKVKIDANHPKVKEIGEKIISYLGENGVADSIVLTSSASPEYGAIENVTGWEKSYPKGTSGTSMPAVGTDDASKNSKLAYDRGVVFSTALSQYLGGHVKANSIQVGWKISTDAPGNGRNISYNIATQSVAPKVIQKTIYRGAKVNIDKADNGIFVYKVNFNAAALTETKEGGFLKKGMVPYEQLKPGMKINILAQDMKTKGEVEVSKVEGNKVFFNKGEKKDLPLPKERYLGQVGKAKGQEAEF
jgi:hypothetical protein